MFYCNCFEVCKLCRKHKDIFIDALKPLHAFARLPDADFIPFSASSHILTDLEINQCFSKLRLVQVFNFCQNWFQFLMLDENVSPAADQPESGAEHTNGTHLFISKVVEILCVAGTAQQAEQPNYLAKGCPEWRLGGPKIGLTPQLIGYVSLNSQVSNPSATEVRHAELPNYPAKKLSKQTFVTLTLYPDPIIGWIAPLGIAVTRLLQVHVDWSKGAEKGFARRLEGLTSTPEDGMTCITLTAAIETEFLPGCMLYRLQYKGPGNPAFLRDNQLYKLHLNRMP
eukprot:1145119-Pelagomonas_calceolata.AAC.5